MSWLLVLLLLHADGSFVESDLPGFRSEDECQAVGRAWAAQAARRNETDVAIFRCRPPRKSAPGSP
jgi:hypothetical protein